MRIAAEVVIAGQEARRLRVLFRYIGDFDFRPELVAERLDLTLSKARRLIARLVEENWIQEAELRDGPVYRLAENGRSLALASFAPLLKRSTAQRKIDELLERVRTANRDSYYLYRVARVLLFGSMLGDSERVGDVDLVVELEPKTEDRGRREAEELARIRAAIKSGRRFSNILEQLHWPRYEVLLFLKSRSRGLSLHGPEDGVMERTESVQLFP